MWQQQVETAYGGRVASSHPSGGSFELEALRTTCQRHETMIATLSEAVSDVHRGAKALEAENAELRADNARMLVQQRSPSRVNGDGRMGEPVEVVLATDVQAPGAARSLVARLLAGRVAPSILDNAQLLISELVTNSVRHSGVAADGQLTVRICLGQTCCRIEVEDRGRDGVIAPQVDRTDGSGMGLNIVQMLSERWGLERIAAGGTRVWAQLTSAPPTAPAPGHPPEVGGARSPQNGKPNSGCAAAIRGWQPPKGSR